MRTITFAILIISAGAGLNYGAELNQEAIKAWDEYLQSAEAQMKERLEGGKPFLWAQERQCRMALLSEGQIPVSLLRRQAALKSRGPLFTIGLGRHLFLE